MDRDILRATADDAEEILRVQRLAYQIEAERYDNYDIPPLKETVDDLKDQFTDHVVLKAVSNNRIVGAVRAREKNGTCFVGRLAVHPHAQNKGIGTALMKAIEKCCKANRYELFVGSKSAKNIHLYEKLGYKTYKEDVFDCGAISLFYMEKKRKGI